MNKILTVAAAAGLISLAACTPPAANNTTEVTLNDTANAAIYDDTANLVVENAVDANMTMDGNMADMNAM